MKYGFVTAAAGLALAFAAMPLPAHHSPASMYDSSRVVRMQGVVTEVEWTNPHAHFFLDVKDATGSTVNWDVELSPPNSLMRQGWRKDDLKPGDQIPVDVRLAKDGSHRACAQAVTLADGRILTCAVCAANFSKQ